MAELDLMVRDRKKLRPYQEKAVASVIESIDAGARPLVIMATGTGKTIVFSEVVRQMYDRKKRSLVLAHREELIDQAIDKIGRQVEYTPSKEKAFDYADLHDRIVVGSVQTLQRKRLERWPKRHFGLITIDEAHHAPSKSYRNIIDYFESGLLGVTATPDRADEKQLGEIFNKVAFEYPLHQAIKDGNLVRIVGQRIKGFNIDLSGLKIVAGDFSADDLAEAIEKYIGPMAQYALDATNDLSTLVFMPNVASSKIMADTLAAMGAKAGYISGSTDGADRKRALYQFSQGQITHLVSCNVLLEGFDEPRTQAIVMGRPTASRALYAQAVGRGTRLYPDKDHVKLVEFTFNSERLKLVTAYELFSTMGLGEQVQQAAAKKGGQQDIEDYLANLEGAHEEVYKIENIVKRLPVIRNGFMEFDPLAVGDLVGVDITGEFDITYEGHKLTGPSTQKQQDLLRRYNIANIEQLDKAQASALIDAIFKKNFIPSIGAASDAQKTMLRRLGFPVRNEVITKAQANMMITMMKGEKR